MDDLDALGKVLRASRTLKHYGRTYPDLEARLRQAFDSGNPWVRKAAEAVGAAFRRRDESDAAWAIEAYGLTATEAKIASHLAAGGTVATYAAEFSVAESTVRTQLKAIFAKVGVNRQADLADRLRRRASPLADPD